MVQRLETLKVTLDDGFYVLIIPNGEYRDFLLSHEQYGAYDHMFSCTVESDDEAIELALGNTEDQTFIYHYLGDHFD